MLVSTLQDDWFDKSYAVFIASIGYEQRARYIADRFTINADKRVALAFPNQHELQFSQNVAFFSESGFEVAECDDRGFRQRIEELFHDMASRPARERKVLVDISSLNRTRIAHIVDVARQSGQKTDADVTYVYSLALFTPPPKIELSQLNSHVGPVLPSFAGWWEEPDRAPVAIVGLGYEEDKALGAVELLQPAEIWVFSPVSEINEYTPALQKANLTLLESVGPEYQMTYRVHEPYDSFVQLESLIYGLSRTRNCILLPFGPKIFTLCSLLVACAAGNVPVWRVSSEGREPAVNRLGSEYIYGISTAFRNATQLPRVSESRVYETT